MVQPIRQSLSLFRMNFNPSCDQESQERLNKQESEKHDKKQIPPGWLDCDSCGQEILGCIIPSKVPLDESFQTNIPTAKTYSFDRVKRSLDAKLSLVIDLTNTCRYYSASDLKQEGIEYVKIRCKGRDDVPDNFSVNVFVYELSKFISRETKELKSYALVHCTHGYNRTGFMIVHYLMRSQSQTLMSVSQAIEIFAQARPLGIYKPDYIDALYAFYNETKPATFTYPSPPRWMSSLNAAMNTNPTPEADPAMKNDDVLGDRIPFNQMKSLRESCYKLLNLQAERAVSRVSSSLTQQGKFTTSEAALLLRYMESRWNSVYDANNS